MASAINAAAASAGIPAGIGKTVLVTGVTGFVGTEVALAYIQHGFFVHGTARSQDKADAWIKLHPVAGKRIKFFIVKDMIVDGCCEEAMQGVDIVAHTASPVFMDAKDRVKEMLEPAIEGTLSVLRTAAKVTSVKRVVVTSSFAAMMDLGKGAAVGTTYTHEDWNPATYEQAVAIDNGGFAYCAAKKLAEKAAWDFVEREKPGFGLSTICPPAVYGPPNQVVSSMDSLNFSSAAIWQLMDGQPKEMPETLSVGGVDVRDIAEAHVLASTLDIAKGQRYLTVGYHYSFDQAAAIIREAFPDKASRVVQGPAKPPPEHFATDSSKAERELGLKWTPFEICIKETAEKLWQIEASLQKA